MNKPMKTPKEALTEAINAAGSQSKLAELLKLNNPSQISSMLNRDGKASAKYVAKISEVTGVPCHELRPDIFPAPTAAANDSNATPHTA